MIMEGLHSTETKWNVADTNQEDTTTEEETMTLGFKIQVIEKEEVQVDTTTTIKVNPTIGTITTITIINTSSEEVNIQETNIIKCKIISRVMNDDINKTGNTNSETTETIGTKVDLHTINKEGPGHPRIEI